MCNHPNPALHLTGYKQLRCFPPAGELERSASASRILGRPCTGRARGDTAAPPQSSQASDSASAASISRRPAPALGSPPPHRPSCRTVCPSCRPGKLPIAASPGSFPTFSGHCSQVFLHHSARPMVAAVCAGGRVQPGCFQRGRRAVGHQPVVGVAPAARAAPLHLGRQPPNPSLQRDALHAASRHSGRP